MAHGFWSGIVSDIMDILGGVSTGGGGRVDSLTLIGNIGDIAGASVNGVGNGLDTAI